MSAHITKALTSEANNPPAFYRRHPWVVRMTLVVGALALMEIGCRLLVRAGVLPFERHPVTTDPVFWDDLSPSFGVWHHPNATFDHHMPCFDVTYRTNSFGMRDPERAEESSADRRVVVLGDSYAEGYGVARGERFTDLLEAESGVEHLNFGASGHFGHVQEWLLYRDLAQRFDHTEVMVFTLPFNDAEDNRPELFPASRYRPYLRTAEAGGFELYYPIDFEQRARDQRKTAEIVRNTLSNNLHLYNILRRATRSLGDDRRPAHGHDSARPSYDSFTKFDTEVLLHTYLRIAELSGDRSVHVFLIPVESDFEAALAGDVDFDLVREIEACASSLEGFHVTDLLPHFVAYAREHGLAYEDFVLRCDGHWNALGHRIAALGVQQAVASRRGD